MTDANVIRLAFHILFHFARAPVYQPPPPPLTTTTSPPYLCVLCDTDRHCCTVILLQCTFQRFYNRRAYRKPIRLKLRLVILTSPANVTANPTYIYIYFFLMKKYVHECKHLPPPFSLIHAAFYYIINERRNKKWFSLARENSTTVKNAHDASQL